MPRLPKSNPEEHIPPPAAAWSGPAREEAVALMEAFRATGASLGEAFGLLVGACGAEVAKPVYQAWLFAAERHPADVVGVLDGVAGQDALAANAWLNEALAGGRIRSWEERKISVFPTGIGIQLDGRAWITSLPGLAGLHVDGCLDLNGCPGLVGLPAGLRVGRDLNLQNCAALKALPAGLDVSWGMDLCGCPALEGGIPDDLAVRGRVFTDAYPGGICVDELRDLPTHS